MNKLILKFLIMIKKGTTWFSLMPEKPEIRVKRNKLVGCL